MTNRIGSLTLAAAVALGSATLGAQTPAAPPPPARAKPAPAPTPTPAAFFEGTVLGPDAKPVAEAVAVVSSTTDSFEPPLVARTGIDGRFRVQARRHGPHTLRVEARGLAAQTIEKARPGTPLRVTLARGGAIEGIVREASSGRPVAGARIEAREEGQYARPPWEPGVGIVAAQSDARGLFKLEGLARGRHTVSASSRAAGRAMRSGVALAQRVELLLIDGPSLTGRVLTPENKPAVGAAVRAEPEVGFGPVRVATAADAGGRFEIPGLTPGAYRLVAFHKDWAVTVWGGVRLDGAGDVEVDVVLGAPARVSGRLVDADERPLPGTVSLQEIDGHASARSLGALVRAEAGADGRFTLERVPPGSHALAAGGRGVGWRRVEIEVGARQKAVEIGDVVLERGAQIRGRVRDKAGAPIADAALRGYADRTSMPGAVPLEGRTEADGTFVLGGATAPSYRLTVDAPGFAPINQAVDAPSEGVELVLDAAGAIKGLVVDDAGRPVESFDVTAQPAGGRDLMTRQPPRTGSVSGEGGSFILEDLAAGAYAVQVAGRDLGRQVVSDVKVAAGAVTDMGRIRLAPGAAVRGTVVDASGAPIAGAAVEARGSDRPMAMSDFQQTSTDSAGGFLIRGLSPGTAIVVARHPDFAEGRSPPLEIEPTRTADTSIVLNRGGRIEGVVRRRGGGAPPDASIMARSVSSPPSYAIPPTVFPRPDGTFSIEHVAPGRVAVALMARGAAGGMGGLVKEVDVREGETARVELVWRDILITGKVTRGGAPLSGVRLTARGEAGRNFAGPADGIAAPSSGPQRMTAITREDGSYEMVVGEAGRLMVRAESTGGRSLLMRMITVADVDSQTIDLDFPAGALSGIVVDEESDAPIARAWVAAVPVTPGPAGGNAMTTADGRFTVDVDPGAFRLRAGAEDYAPTTVEATVGESPAAEIRIALSRGGQLRGKVLDVRGRPAPGLRVAAQAEADESVSASVTSSVDGTFEFSTLRPGSYALSGGSPLSGFGILSGITPGATDVVLQLSPGGRIRLSATEGEETPVDGAVVMIRRVNGVRVPFLGPTPRTGEDGTTELDSPAGLIEVEVRQGGLAGRGQATVTPGGLAELEVTLSEEAAQPAP